MCAVIEESHVFYPDHLIAFREWNPIFNFKIQILTIRVQQRTIIVTLDQVDIVTDNLVTQCQTVNREPSPNG